MEIRIHIDATIHIHQPGSLQPAIDKINELTKDETAKTGTLQNAVDTAKGNQS